jgi:DNA-binding HxlR family transcriptional regulator
MKMLGNRWNMIAIRYLHDEPMKYNQLRRAMGNVSSKTLSRSLKHLVKEEIVKRRVLATSPISVEYSLTERGRELSDALYGMKDWGKRWLAPENLLETSRKRATDNTGSVQTAVIAGPFPNGATGYHVVDIGITSG